MLLMLAEKNPFLCARVMCKRRSLPHTTRITLRHCSLFPFLRKFTSNRFGNIWRHNVKIELRSTTLNIEYYYRSINFGKSIITSFLLNTSFLSPGVQKISTAFKQYPSSTMQSLAILVNTSFVP